MKQIYIYIYIYIYICDVQLFERIRSFGDNVYIRKISINQTEMDQTNLLENMIELNDKSRSENLQNEIRQIIYSLYQAKRLPKQYIIM